MINPILASTIVMTTTAFIFAIILSILNKILTVKVDEKFAELRKVLPGVDCGACGYPSCDAFTKAVLSGKAPPDGCKVGGKKTADQVIAIVGRKGEGAIKEVAKLKCNAGCDKSGIKAEYKGIQTCNAAAQIGGGYKQCDYGCLGIGDCATACKFDAIKLDYNGLPHVNYEKCTACGACIEACPKSLFHLVGEKHTVHVACMSQDKGPKTIKNCKVGCIACGICEKECPVDAIHVRDNIASIDYEKCISCGICVEKCPRKIIIKEEKKIVVKKEKEDSKKIEKKEEDKEKNKTENEKNMETKTEPVKKTDDK